MRNAREREIISVEGAPAFLCARGGFAFMLRRPRGAREARSASEACARQQANNTRRGLRASSALPPLALRLAARSPIAADDGGLTAARRSSPPAKRAFAVAVSAPIAVSPAAAPSAPRGGSGCFDRGITPPNAVDHHRRRNQRWPATTGWWRALRFAPHGVAPCPSPSRRSSRSPTTAPSARAQGLAPRARLS